jgi:hypothetical protein
MKTIRLCLFGLLFCALPAVAHAESDWWDVIEGFSGPGPFKGVTFGERVFCVKENADRGGFGTSTCISDVDERIRALVNAEFGYYTSGDKPRFADTPQDTRTVNMWRIHATYFYRVSPLLDLGAGAGVMIFTGEGFDSQSHFVMTPLSLVFTPLGFIRSTPKATKWGRLLRVNFSENYVPGDIKASDFNSTSSYATHGEFNRKFGIGVDIGPFMSK